MASLRIMIMVKPLSSYQPDSDTTYSIVPLYLTYPPYTCRQHLAKNCKRLKGKVQRRRKRERYHMPKDIFFCPFSFSSSLFLLLDRPRAPPQIRRRSTVCCLLLPPLHAPLCICKKGTASSPERGRPLCDAMR